MIRYEERTSASSYQSHGRFPRGVGARWVGARETHLSNRTCYSLCLANYNLWPRSFGWSVGAAAAWRFLAYGPGEGFRDSSGSSNSSSSEAARSRSFVQFMCIWWVDGIFYEWVGRSIIILHDEIRHTHTRRQCNALLDNLPGAHMTDNVQQPDVVEPFVTTLKNVLQSFR